MYGVTIQELIDKMKLKNMTPEIDMEKAVLTHPDVNRPALQLAGFFDHFDNERVQIIGYVEQEYLRQMDLERKIQVYDQLLEAKIPCLVYSRSQIPDENMLERCNYYEGSTLITRLFNVTSFR